MTDFNYHKKIKHGISVSKTVQNEQQLVCLLCSLKASKQELLTHFQSVHDLIITAETHEFSSLAEFKTWKTETEKETQALYVKSTRTWSTQNGDVLNFVCHRSGNYIAKGKGLRHLKMKGSNKINGFCPASMKVVVDKDKKCKVHFMHEHIGHGNSLNASTCDGRSPKAVMDSVEFVKEKEKVLALVTSQLKQTSENIFCMEQLDALKKICLSIDPTITAVGNRFRETLNPTALLRTTTKSTEPSFSRQHNEKITPQRKLRSIKVKKR